MRDRWLNIYHIYHQFGVCQLQVECPGTVPQFGHSLPTPVAMSAQTAGPSTSVPLTGAKCTTYDA